MWKENFPPVLLPVIYLKKNKNTYSTLSEKNLQFILHISVKDNDLKKQKHINWVHYPKEIIYIVEMTTTVTINGSRRIEAWGSSSKNTKNKHRCKHICAVISLICGFALVILGILIVLFFRDLVDKIIKSVSQNFFLNSLTSR